MAEIINEEFDESEVVFTGNNVGFEEGDSCLKCFADSDQEESRRPKRKKIEMKKPLSKPKVVKIPENYTWVHYMEPSFSDDEDEEEMVPPHVLVRRRVAAKMAFSVCSGIGRTLKGRDLSEMRNSVLRMTGFLET